MQPEYAQIFQVIAIGTLLTLLVSAFLVSFVVAHRRKRNDFLKEKRELEESYNHQLLQSQLEVQEQTRLHIAEELHDNIGALSSLIKINLNLLSPTQGADRNHQLIEESKSLVRALIADVKQLSISLHTNRICNMGIVEAIHTEVKRMQKLELFTTHFSTEGEEASLPDDKQIILYRICQELLHNIVKHAQPKNVTVAVNFALQQLTVSIKDDGIGFDVENATKKMNGSGLINLYNRAKLIGGSLYLNSNVAAGTHCTIQIPIPPIS